MVNSYYPDAPKKVWVTIVTVDPRTRQIEARLKDGIPISLAVWETPPFFRWPREGEEWTAIYESNFWRLGEHVGGDKELVIEGLMPGEGRIDADKLYISGEAFVSGEAVVLNNDPRFDEPGLPVGPAGGVLSGAYPNPGFAVDMATQAELDAVSSSRAALGSANTFTANQTITVADAGLILRSGNAANFSRIYMGRTSNEGTLAVAGAAGQFVTGSVAGDLIVMQQNSATLHLGSGSGAAAIKILGASATLQGIPTAPTAAVDTNTTQLATTAFVLGQASNVAPLMDGTQALGTSSLYARQDHVHASDTSRVATSDTSRPTLVGDNNFTGNNSFTGTQTLTAIDITSGSGPAIKTRASGAASAFEQRLLASDTYPTFSINGFGTLSWGDGGVSAIDTTLGRPSGGVLAMSTTAFGLVGPSSAPGIRFHNNNDGVIYSPTAGSLNISTSNGALGFYGATATTRIESPTQTRVGGNPSALTTASTLPEVIAQLSRVMNLLQTMGIMGITGWSS